MSTSPHEEIQREFSAAAADVIARLRRRAGHAPFSPDAWRMIADAGWFEVLLADELGGLALGLEELGPIHQQAGLALLAGPLFEHTVVAALVASAAPRSGRDVILEALRLPRVVAVVDGDAGGGDLSLRNGRLSGAVDAVRFGADADLFIAVGNRPHPFVAWLAADTPGIRIEPQVSLDPTVNWATVAFDGAAVDPEHALRAAGSSQSLIRKTRTAIRLMLSWELAGIAGHALAIAVQYAKEREQFGRPIGAFQAIQQLLADMARETYSLERLCREGTRAVVRAPAGAETVAPIVKAYASAATRRVVERSLQVHGGIGFTMEHELHRYYKHVLALEGLYGQPEEVLEALGRELLTSEKDAVSVIAG